MLQIQTNDDDRDHYVLSGLYHTPPPPEHRPVRYGIATLEHIYSYYSYVYTALGSGGLCQCWDRVFLYILYYSYSICWHSGGLCQCWD